MAGAGRAAKAFALLLGIGAAVADPMPATAQSDAISTAEIEAGATEAHPAALYMLAADLFEQGERDRAVFWFYVGQLRYRFHLAASPQLDPTGDPALFSSLSESVGRPINEYAFGDLQALDATLGVVLEWDAANDNRLTSKSAMATAWNDTRAGLEGLRRMLREDADEIRATRQANGLENR
jgi:hypothetical protein